MPVRLRSEHDNCQTLALNGNAWLSILDLAGKHGWAPMGAIRPEWLAGLNLTGVDFAGVEENSEDGNRLAAGLAIGGYSPHTDRFVLIEDALNLGDALERAFLEGEIKVESPRSIVYQSHWEAASEDLKPGVAVLTAIIDLCRQGGFWIERF